MEYEVSFWVMKMFQKWVWQWLAQLCEYNTKKRPMGHLKYMYTYMYVYVDMYIALEQ